MFEKYLKARLNEAGIVIKKSHDLSILLNDLLPAEPNWLVIQITLGSLTKYAVLYRYPGFNATKLEAKQVLQDTQNLRRFIRIAFGLPV